jgi:hypothetical protein
MGRLGADKEGEGRVRIKTLDEMGCPIVVRVYQSAGRGTDCNSSVGRLCTLLHVYRSMYDMV